MSEISDETSNPQQFELHKLASGLALAEERERRRIAVGLHDQVGHNLALARTNVSVLLSGNCSGRPVKHLQDALESMDRAIASIRSLTFELSSPILYDLGLETALEDLGERVAGANDMEFRFHTDGQPKPLKDDGSVVVFRAVRELLVNVMKHAQARKVAIAMERVADRMRIVVEDDGVGLDTSTLAQRSGPTGGFGLASARRQMEEVEGRFTLESAPGACTRITLEVPLDLSGERPTTHPSELRDS